MCYNIYHARKTTRAGGESPRNSYTVKSEKAPLLQVSERAYRICPPSGFATCAMLMQRQFTGNANTDERSDTMRNIRLYLALALSSIVFHPSVANATDSSEVRKSTFVELSYPFKIQTDWKKVKITVTPPKDYWEKVAICESSKDGDNPRWNDKGKFAGGLGIYTNGKFGDSDMGTWERWGGEQFAPSPDKATKEEQIKIANRIAVLGWKTTIHRDPKIAKIKGIPAVYEYHKKPIGFSGWGCVKSKSTGKWRIGLPKNWSKHVYVKLPTNQTMYCKHWEPIFRQYQLPAKLFSYIAWRESRCQTDVVGFNFKPGTSKDSCDNLSVVCPAVKSYDSGLLQINSTWKTVTSQVCKSHQGDLTVLQDPFCNIKVAKYLYDFDHNRFKNWNIKVYKSN